MTAHPLLALIDAPIIIGILVVGALLFGADKLPKLARSAGQAKREFLVGQAEADEAVAKAREDARQRDARQHADIMDNVEAGSMSGEAIPPPTPGRGTPKFVTRNAGAATRAGKRSGDVGPKGDAVHGAPAGAP